MAIYIRTISEFLALTEEQRAAIVAAIDTGPRLASWFARTKEFHGEEECRHCNGNGFILHEKRNNADIHASSIDKCLKTMHYCVTGRAGEKRESIDTRTRVTFDIGKAWHLWLQMNYGLRGAWGDPADYYPEVEINPDAVDEQGNPVYQLAADLRIRSSVDAVVDNYYLPRIPIFGDEQVIIRLLHEYKTMKEENYEKLTKPKKDHVKQATIYAVVTDTPFISFMYFNKNTGTFVDFSSAVDLNIWNDIKGKCQRVLDLARHGLEVPWEETSAELSPYECRSCGFAHICRPQDRPK